MSRCILCSITLCLMLVGTSPGWARMWTDNTGKFSVEAEFVEVKDGKVLLKKDNGKVFQVPIERLSDADQRYVASRGEQPQSQVDAVEKTARAFLVATKEADDDAIKAVLTKKGREKYSDGSSGPPGPRAGFKIGGGYAQDAPATRTAFAGGNAGGSA